MEQLIFEDYIKDDKWCHQDKSYSIVMLVIKQISRGRFEIADDICKVKILLNGEEKIVVISNIRKTEELKTLVKEIYHPETSLSFLQNKMQNSGIESLFEFLKEYKDEYYKLGSEFENEYCYKFYSTTEIEDETRKSYQVRWIDFEKQLEKGNKIFDELGVYGLSAMPDMMLSECFGEKRKKRYGNQLFLLKIVPKCRYIQCIDEERNEEIIGDEFEVMKKYDLDSIEDLEEVIKDLSELKKSEISELKKKIEDSELKKKIEDLERENNRYKKFKGIEWLFFLGGFILGIICKFR